MWDVGAGSGAVAIEAARIAHEGQVFAIESDAEDHQLLTANARRFQIGDTLIPVLGLAPEAWAELPDPDAVFVGGTGRAVGWIVEQAIQRLRAGGRLVVNVNSLHNLLAVHQVLSQAAGECMVRMIQLAHAHEQLGSLCLESMNPTFLVSFVKSARTGVTSL